MLDQDCKAIVTVGWKLGEFTNAAAKKEQGRGLPIVDYSEVLQMSPYLATIVAVAGLVGRVRAPAADGQPYMEA